MSSSSTQNFVQKFCIAQTLDPKDPGRFRILLLEVAPDLCSLCKARLAWDTVTTPCTGRLILF